MAKVLKCGDLMPGCDTVIVGKDADEVLAKAEAHARKEHNMTIIPPNVVSQIEAAIKDQPSQLAGSLAHPLDDRRRRMTGLDRHEHNPAAAGFDGVPPDDLIGGPVCALDENIRLKRLDDLAGCPPGKSRPPRPRPVRPALRRVRPRA